MASKRTIVLIDGQNLYRGAKDAWLAAGSVSSPYTWPSYDVKKLSEALTALVPGRYLSQVRFYSGVPSPVQSELWHHFWTNKMRSMLNEGVKVYKGRISPQNQEKGVDVSIAIELIKLTYENAYDAAIIVSSDSDLGPAVHLAKSISKAQGRCRDFESAFPFHDPVFAPRGIPGTTWVHIDKALYDNCYDHREYRKSRSVK